MSVLPSGSVLRMVAAGYGPSAPSGHTVAAGCGPAAPASAPGLAPPGLVSGAQLGGLPEASLDGWEPARLVGLPEASLDGWGPSQLGGLPEASLDGWGPATVHGSEDGAADSGFSTLRNHLQDLFMHYDPRQVFITRGISRMGFQSKELLEVYFARYGTVLRVMVPYSKSKRLARNLHPQARVHPGSLAFVVMVDAECVGKILAVAEHAFEGYSVRVEKFQQAEGVGPVVVDTGETVSAGCASRSQPPGISHRAAGPLGHAAAAAGPAAGNAGSPRQWRYAGSPAPEPPLGLGAAAGFLGVGLDESLLGSPTVAAQLSDPNSVVCRLASIARDWEDTAVASGEHCAQAITATQVAQLQLQGLLDRCTQNLRALWLNREQSHGGAPDAVDQLEGLLAGQARAAEAPPYPAHPYAGAGGTAWPAGDPQDELLLRGGAGAAAGPPQPRQVWSAEFSLDGQKALGLQRQLGARPELRRLVASEQAESEQRLGAEAEAAQPPCRASGGPAAGRQVRARAGRGSGEDSACSSGEEARRRRLSLHNGSMGDLLTILNGEDPHKVFIVRGIDALGIDSHEMLASHYWDFGIIERVLVPHSKVTAKLHRSEKTVTRSRVRPGSMGFVVMAECQSVERILQAGGQQVVAGKCIRVEPFKVPDVAGCATSAATSAGSTSISGPSSSNQSRSDASSHGSHAVSHGSSGSHGFHGSGSKEYKKSGSRSGDSGSSDSKGGPGASSGKRSNSSEKDDGSRSNDSETGSGSNGTGAAPRSGCSGSEAAEGSSARQESAG